MDGVAWQARRDLLINHRVVVDAEQMQTELQTIEQPSLPAALASTRFIPQSNGSARDCLFLGGRGATKNRGCIAIHSQRKASLEGGCSP